MEYIFSLKPFFTKKNKMFQKLGIWNTRKNWNSCTGGSSRFFTPSKLEHTPMKEGTPPPHRSSRFFHFFQDTFLWKKALLPSLQEFQFSHVFEGRTHPNERRHFPLYQNSRFFTPSKLEHFPMNEGTPPSSTEAPVFLCSTIFIWNIFRNSHYLRK